MVYIHGRFMFETVNSSLRNECIFLNDSASWYGYGYGKEYFWISGVLLVIFGTIGLLGNILTMAVLCRPKMRKTVFYNLLLALACFDTLFILSYGISIAHLSFACPPRRLVHGLFYPVRELCLVGSIYMTVAVSMERYLGICHPHLQFSRGALLFILPVVLISLVFNFPKFFETNFYGQGPYLLTESKYFIKTFNYGSGYGLWASVIVKTLIPLLSLLFLNISIFATVKGTTHPQRTQARRETNTTTILFCVVLIFLLAHVPRVAHKFLFFLEFEKKASWYWVTPVYRLSLIINSSVNFVIYAMVGRNFRSEFLQLFQCQKIPPVKTNKIVIGTELPLKQLQQSKEG